MASFPALFSGEVSLEPLIESVRQRVPIHQFTNFTEQRWVEMAALRRFALTLDNIQKADRDTLEAFFETMKGGFDHTWDITLGGATYQNMVFDSDVFSCRESSPEYWSIALTCHQVRKN